MTTIHDITNTQTIVDKAHKDLRRARAASESLIPTTTGSAKAITAIFPELTGKLNGLAVRVPLLNASLTDFVFEATRDTDVENGFLAAADFVRGSSALKLAHCVHDYRGDKRSSIVDAGCTMVMTIDKSNSSLYDNEWGYVNRMMELTLIAKQLYVELNPQLLIVTGAYWGFTVTDGVIRMLWFRAHTLGYTPSGNAVCTL